MCVLEAAIARERLYQYLAAALNSAEAAADVDAAWRGVRRGTGATSAMARARSARQHGRGVRDGRGAACATARARSAT